MKHNELRAGNIINRHFENGEGEQTEITVRDIFDCKRAELEPDFKFSFTGIELTPEWLERFGFEYADTMSDDYTLKPISIYNNPFKKGFDVEMMFGVQLPEDSINVQYVHQLQNLFFSLTGRELELKK